MLRFRDGLRSMALGVLVVLATPLAAAAQSELDEDARLHFELGERAYHRGDFDTAISEFEASYQLSSRAALLYNLYLAHRDAGQNERAADRLRQYLRDVPDAQNHARLQVILRNLERQLAGEEPEDPEPSGGGGATAVSTRTATDPGSGGSASSGGGGISPVGFILIGVGGAAAITGAITGGVALGNQGTLDEMCTDGVCDPSLESVADEGRALAIAADVLLPVGIVTAGVGVVLLFVLDGGSGDQAQARLTCGPTFCGGSARWTF